MSNPQPEFVKYFIGKVYDGRTTEKVLAQFTELVKKTFEQTFNDIVSDRLMNAINQTKVANDVQPDNSAPVDSDENKIITTDEELNGFYIVKSILRTKISSDRIVYRDSVSYFSIILDDNNRKPLCRLWLNGQSKKHLGLFDKDKKETKIEIASLDDIYNYSQQLIDTIGFYDSEK